jgi:hypothetical protein
MYHYTYYSYEPWGRGYIGSRSCKCLPEEDIKYFGSYADKSFNPSLKIIIKDDYRSREDAITDEVILHNFYNVSHNKHFTNKSKQTSSKFDTTGIVPWNKGIVCSEETKEKIKEKVKGREPWNKGKKGAQKFSDESKKKISERLKNEFANGRRQWNAGTGMSDEEKRVKQNESSKAYYQRNIERLREEKREKYLLNIENERARRRENYHKNKRKNTT